MKERGGVVFATIKRGVEKRKETRRKKKRHLEEESESAILWRSCSQEKLVLFAKRGGFDSFGKEAAFLFALNEGTEGWWVQRN